METADVIKSLLREYGFVERERLVGIEPYRNVYVQADSGKIHIYKRSDWIGSISIKDSRIIGFFYERQTSDQQDFDINLASPNALEELKFMVINLTL